MLVLDIIIRVGTTHMVSKNVESSVTDVKKAVVKARIHASKESSDL